MKQIEVVEICVRVCMLVCVVLCCVCSVHWVEMMKLYAMNEDGADTHSYYTVAYRILSEVGECDIIIMCIKTNICHFIAYNWQPMCDVEM